MIKKSKIICKILYPDKNKTYTNLKSVTLPSVKGRMLVLPNHAESFIVLKHGEIILKNTNTKVLKIEGGECHIKNNIITCLL